MNPKQKAEARLDAAEREIKAARHALEQLEVPQYKTDYKVGDTVRCTRGDGYIGIVESVTDDAVYARNLKTNDLFGRNWHEVEIAKLRVKPVPMRIRTYPKLMQINSNAKFNAGAVLWMTSPNKGVVVVTSGHPEGSPLGHYSKGWMPHTLEDFQGTLEHDHES